MEWLLEMIRNRRFSRASRRQFVKSSLAVAMSVPLMPRLGQAQDRQVNVYNWDTYIGSSTLDDFSEATGISVRYDLFADNAELFGRLREGNPGYDVIVPTNDWTARMALAGMIQKLDHSKIPNLANIEDRFLNPDFDPGRQHSVPYFWGTIGIGYRQSALELVPDSWGWIFDKPGDFAGRISWLGEPSTVMQMCLKYLGLSLNSTDFGELSAAEEVLTRSKANVKAIAGDNGQDLLLSEEIDLAMEWNGDLLQVIAEDDDLAYVVPKEGALLWEDTMAIATGAPHPEEAHEFINFILEADTHAAIAEEVYYALPNKAAKALMSAEYLENPTIFPPEGVLASCETAKYLGEEINSFYDQAMTRVRAA
jgi:spermidine/putrescine transport system substrate-binding protein